MPFYKTVGYTLAGSSAVLMRALVGKNNLRAGDVTLEGDATHAA